MPPQRENVHGKEYHSSAKHGEKSPPGRAQEQQEGDVQNINKQEGGKQAPEKVKGDKEHMAVNK